MADNLVVLPPPEPETATEFLEQLADFFRRFCMLVESPRVVNMLRGIERDAERFAEVTRAAGI